MTAKKEVTHRDLTPKHLCPAMIMKPMLTHGMDDVVRDGREWPGDGHYWCAKTCTCIGPDDEHVHPKDCLPGRACYDGPQP